MADPALSLPSPAYEEYERIERNNTEKLEYLRGASYLMAGGSPRHAMISGNCFWRLRSLLAPSECIVFPQDLHIVTPQNQADFIPDVTVICRANVEELPHRVPNPTLVVEVLSPSTRMHDLGNKLSEYQRIPSLRAILYIDSETLTVRLWSRPENSTWPSEPNFHQHPESQIALPIGVTLLLKELYEGTGLL